MSGGYFDYCQFKMDEPIEKLEFMVRTQHDKLDTEIIKKVRFVLGLMVYSRECLDTLDKFMSDDIGRAEFMEDFKILMEYGAALTTTKTNVDGGEDAAA